MTALSFLLVAASAAAVPGRTVIAWNAYAPVERWCRELAPYVGDGEIVLVTEGNGGKPANPSTALEKYRKVARALEELGKRDLRFGIYTSDLDNVRVLAPVVGREKGIEFIAYGYEPGYAKEFPKGPDGGWIFTTALANVSMAARIVHSADRKLMVIPSGRPLLEREVRKYGWQYPDFLTKAGADLMLVQTQTFVYQDKFVEAMEILNGQVGGDASLRDRIMVQVTVEPERIANRNGVSAERAWEAARQARECGYRTVSLWPAYRDLESSREFMRLAGRRGPETGTGRE